MSINLGPAFRAGGTISICRFVSISATADNTVLQATATTLPIGVSQEGQRAAPGLPGTVLGQAAIAGDQIQVIGPGNVALVEVGAAVVRGAPVAPDANGRAVTAANVTAAGNNRFVGGIALESAAAANERIKILVTSPSA